MEELGKGKYLIDHLLWVGESELKNQEKSAKSAIEDLKQYSSMVNRALDIDEITMAVDEIRKYPKKQLITILLIMAALATVGLVYVNL